MKKTANPTRIDPEEMEVETNLNRRNVFKLVLTALAGVAGIEIGSAGLLFLQARSLEGKFGGTITAGPIENFQPGTVTEFIEGNFYLVRSDDGGFLAVSRRCPHLGCTVSWVDDKEKFYCPCHASSFDVYGEYQNDLISRSLDTFPVSFNDEMVKVDTSLAQTREHYQPGQVSYPAAKN